MDDGTGTLDCILWLKEPSSLEKIFDLKKDVKSGRIRIYFLKSSYPLKTPMSNINFKTLKYEILVCNFAFLEMASLSGEMKKCALSLLQKAEMSTTGEEQQYSHGDIISCLGNVKVYRNKPQLEILHHCILSLE